MVAAALRANQPPYVTKIGRIGNLPKCRSFGYLAIVKDGESIVSALRSAITSVGPCS